MLWKGASGPQDAIFLPTREALVNRSFAEMELAFRKVTVIRYWVGTCVSEFMEDPGLGVPCLPCKEQGLKRGCG